MIVVFIKDHTYDHSYCTVVVGISVYLILEDHPYKFYLFQYRRAINKEMNAFSSLNILVTNYKQIIVNLKIPMFIGSNVLTE